MLMPAMGEEGAADLLISGFMPLCIFLGVMERSPPKTVKKTPAASASTVRSVTAKSCGLVI